MEVSHGGDDGGGNRGEGRWGEQLRYFFITV